MAGRSPSRQFAKYSEIQEELRNAGDYLASLMQYEVVAANALEKDGDPASVEEAERLFLRDFKAFIGAVRSARAYISGNANKTGHDKWLETRTGRTESKYLFDFFRLLANQALHLYRPRLEPRSKKVQYVAEPDAVLMQTPLGAIPSKMRVVGVVDAKYFFRLSDLEKATEEAYTKLESQFPGEGVISLSARYYNDLYQILKNAQRNKRFDSISV